MIDPDTVSIPWWVYAVGFIMLWWLIAQWFPNKRKDD